MSLFPRGGPHHYRAFGLAIASDMALPELVPAPAGPADLTIRVVHTGREFPAPEAPGTFRFGDTQCFLLYPQIGAFRIAAPRLIEVEPRPGIDPALVAFPLLGPVLALLLQARGSFLLHGSALAGAGGASFAFLGDKGAGKSTTAAAFLRAGYALLTDDIIAIEGLERSAGTISPAFPQVKLTEAASAALAGADLDARPGVPLVRDKQRFLVGSGFAEASHAPGHFFLLTRGPELALRPLEPKERMKAFLRFSYGTRFGAAAITPAIAARHARQCAALAHTAQAAILTVPHDLGALGEVVDFVAGHLGT
ncbi:serine kinase [Erythrobacter sp. NE805]|uniref:serine kinase n=1 Tax=Erythrobacter sp. NE805 TaxID=3389875 RepID=UPI00396B172F